MKNIYLKISAVIILAVFCTATFAQVNKQIQWRKNYGGGGEDFPGTVVNTFDGGYIYCATTYSDDQDVHGLHGGSSSDVWLVKINSVGDTQWTKTYGGTYGEWGKAIIQTPDSGFVFVADARSNDGDLDTNYGDWDVWVVKINKMGVIQWQNVYGGSGYEEVTSIYRHADGTYYIGAMSESSDVFLTNNYGGRDFWVFKLSANGNMVWQKNYGGDYDDNLYTITGNENVVYVAGNTWSDSTFDVSYSDIGGFDYWILKIDTAGSKIWNRRTGSTDHDAAYSAVYTSDKGVLVGGYAILGDGDVDTTLSQWYSDGWVVKLDSLGNEEWQQSYGGDSSDVIQKILPTADGGYIIGGYTFSSSGMVTTYHGAQDIWVTKVDNNGNPQWYQSLGGSGIDGTEVADYKYAFDIVQASDNGYLLVTQTESNNNGDVGPNKGLFDVWAVKLKCSPPFAAEICMVSYDTAAKKNEVVWEDSGYPGNIESVNVYRETATTGIYALIGNVPVSGLSHYVDNSTLANPFVQPFRYKIAAVDSCGNVSDTSAFHRTVLLQANLGTGIQINLSWNDYIGYTPVKYYIYRFTFSNPNAVLLDSIAAGGNPNTWNDIAPPTNDTARYFISILPPYACTSSKNYNDGRSNTAARASAGMGIKNEVASSSMVVNPNPSNGIFSVTFEGITSDDKTVISIFNITGQSVYETVLNAGLRKQSLSIDLSDKPKGVYLMQMKNSETTKVSRVIIR